MAPDLSGKPQCRADWPIRVKLLNAATSRPKNGNGAHKGAGRSLEIGRFVRARAGWAVRRLLVEGPRGETSSLAERDSSDDENAENPNQDDPGVLFDELHDRCSLFEYVV